MDKNKLDISKKTGERIKYFRTLKKMSQEELALEAELSTTYIGHIERGIKCPTINTLNKICCVLDISLPQLLDFKHDNTYCDNAADKLYMALKELDSNERARLTEIMIEFVGLIKDSKKE